MALEVEADRRVTEWLYVRCPSAWRCDSPDRDLRPRAAKRATMLFPGRNRDTHWGRAESERSEGSLFGRRASLVVLSASAASSSRGHGEGLPSLSSHLSPGTCLPLPCVATCVSGNRSWASLRASACAGSASRRTWRRIFPGCASAIGSAPEGGLWRIA